jgi:uncharacterized protein YdeI (YjbR/CyaY-like superfamily)
MSVKFFKSSNEFRKWLAERHDKSSELWLGFYKKKSGKASLTYQQALDEALCFGWIDGVRKSQDEDSYIIRFSPRKAKSTWSRVNIKRAEELKRLGRLKPPGIGAFESRDPRKSGIYSFENAERKLNPDYEKRFKAYPKAWAFFLAQPPGYKRTASFWVMSAKKEDTRLRRLARLVADSDKGVRLGIVTVSSRSREA